MALGLARNSEIFKVGFDMAGTHAGPIAAIDTWNSPVMLVQGDDDRNVNFSQGTNLVRELLTKRPHVELVQRVFPNEVHDMYLTFEDTIDTYNMGAQFMLDHLLGEDAVEVPADVGGTVPPTLSLSLGASSGFGAFTPGVARDYTRERRRDRDLERGRRGADRRGPEHGRTRGGWSTARSRWPSRCRPASVTRSRRSRPRSGRGPGRRPTRA